MDKISRLEKYHGVDVGFGDNCNLEPLNGRGRVGKSGIDKTLTLGEVMELAYEIRANIIVKGGRNAKWYLKRFDKNIIEEKIRKQEWRDTSRVTMWVVVWE
jgi:hypothetical protein